MSTRSFVVFLAVGLATLCPKAPAQSTCGRQPLNGCVTNWTCTTDGWRPTNAANGTICLTSNGKPGTCEGPTPHGVVAAVAATCVADSGQTYAIGGTVSGLSGGAVTLLDTSTAGGSVLSVTANGSFTFRTKLYRGQPYSVSVLNSPTGQVCTLLPSSSSGTVGNRNITGVAVTCVSNSATVWGFADLHTHPASHLAFGSDGNGNNGLFWGKPADDANLASLDLANDLAACDHLDHNPGAIDLIQIASDVAMMSAFQGTVSLPFNDTGQGNTTFASWPSAISIEHQQMDISSIHRAFDGGLRLLFASVTDDELINALWNQKFNAGGQGPPIHDPSFDFRSAIKQLTYIQALAAANANWMQIVTSPSEARAAILNGKLAIVLSLEMDTLTLNQVLLLVQNFQVRHVIPVHLVDNPAFGGTAIYSDEFNSENPFYNNGQFYSPTPDSDVTFNLSTSPSLLTPMLPPLITTVLNLEGLGPAVTSLVPGLTFLCSQNIVLTFLGLPPAPCQVATGEFGYLPWPISPPGGVTGPPGQINSAHLNRANFLSLMTARCGTAPCGLFLDVAHMGQRTALDALNLAAQYQFPLMDSHTGIRCDGVACSSPYGWVSQGVDPTGMLVQGSPNERSLPTSQLQMIKNLGGVIGLGEVAGGEGSNSGPIDPNPVGSWIKSYSIVWSLMGNRGVAFGTDTNGLSPLIPSDTVATGYPITVAQDFGGPPGTSQLPEFQLGSTQFDFEKVGIATYGLLPDFIQAASLRPAGVDPNASAPSAAIWAIFHSAEDTIEMWEKVLAVQPDIPIGGSNQVVTSCNITAMGPWSAGTSIPVLGQPIQIYTELLDQVGLPMTFPLTVVYSGNISGMPTGNLVTGLDHVTVNVGLPNTYNLTASVTSVSTVSCVYTLNLPPILTAISSPLSLDPGAPGLTPLANADGSTQLTLTGVGFANPTSVTVGNTSVWVNPTSASQLVVNAPYYSGSNDEAVNVYVTSATGLQSNKGTIQYFHPNVPAVTAYSSESCAGDEKFVVDVYALNAGGGLVENSATPVKFTIGGLSGSDKIDSSGEADFIGNFASLRPAGRQIYSGTASYAGNRARFLVKRPQPPSPATCGGWANSATPTGSGAIFPHLPTCFACKLTDLPDYFSNSRFYIDDLIALGAMLPSGSQFSPDAAVPERTFLFALAKVLNPVRAKLISPSANANAASQRPITRGEAAALVSHLIAIESGDGSIQARTAAATRAGYLPTVDGVVAPERQLTRLEFTYLLWHVARAQLAELAKKDSATRAVSH
jgi:microsomal dipeptidase-like Zn-dependent dipeptidase